MSAVAVKGMGVTEVSPKPVMEELLGSVMSRKSLAVEGTAISKPYVNSLGEGLGECGDGAGRGCTRSRSCCSLR
jgi:hypothetical protein